MPETDKSTDFETRLKARLSGDSAPLDGYTRSRLNRARQRALTELERPSWLKLAGVRGWLPAGGAVAAAVLVALLVRQAPLQNGIPSYAPADDMEIILSDEDLELYEEDLEFYAWLEMQPELSST